MQEGTLISLLTNIKINYDNANNEVEDHTLHFLQKYKKDNLLEMMIKASKRGYSAVEWIDFWGVGGIDSKITIKWAYGIIKEQGLDTIIEPYHNNFNHRLGITIHRNLLGKQKMVALSMELQNKKSDPLSNNDYTILPEDRVGTVTSLGAGMPDSLSWEKPKPSRRGSSWTTMVTSTTLWQGRTPRVGSMSITSSMSFRLSSSDLTG